MDNQKLRDWIEKKRKGIDNVTLISDEDRGYKEGALSILLELEYNLEKVVMEDGR